MDEIEKRLVAGYSNEIEGMQLDLGEKVMADIRRERILRFFVLAGAAFVGLGAIALLLSGMEWGAVVLEPGVYLETLPAQVGIGAMALAYWFFAAFVVD